VQSIPIPGAAQYRQHACSQGQSEAACETFIVCLADSHGQNADRKTSFKTYANSSASLRLYQGSKFAGLPAVALAVVAIVPNFKLPVRSKDMID
jgi:hypothetical protein